MSHVNDIEESYETVHPSLLSHDEIKQIRKEDYLLPMGTSNSIYEAVLEESTHLPIIPNIQENDDDTSESLDTISRVIRVGMSPARFGTADQICLDLPESSVERSHSNVVRSPTPDSSDEDADAFGFDLLATVWERSPSESSKSATSESFDGLIGEDEDLIHFDEIPGSTCGRSNSETSRLDTPASTEFSFLRESDNLFLRYLHNADFALYTSRQKGYLLPFELLCLAFTITSCYMGAYYWPMCPANDYLPKYVFFSGAIATFSLCVEIMDSLWKLLLRPTRDARRYFCAFSIGWIAIITTLVEMTEFYWMSYSFDRTEGNYCDETFYWFVFYKNIAFGVLMSLTGLLYIPSFDYTYFIWEYVD